jgi:hypothetical protein
MLDMVGDQQKGCKAADWLVREILLVSADRKIYALGCAGIFY